MALQKATSFTSISINVGTKYSKRRAVRCINRIRHASERDEIPFIDEIQNVEGFEEVINGFRSEGDYSIFITGSNSYLLSGELVTKLTGRYLEFEMFPLTFDEYEDMKKFYGRDIDANAEIELNHYILEGGFPRAIKIDNLSDKRTYVRGIIDEIFEKISNEG